MEQVHQDLFGSMLNVLTDHGVSLTNAVKQGEEDAGELSWTIEGTHGRTLSLFIGRHGDIREAYIGDKAGRYVSHRFSASSEEELWNVGDYEHDRRYDHDDLDAGEDLPDAVKQMLVTMATQHVA